MNRIYLYIGLFIAGVILGYYLVPAKEKVVIKYKDRIVKQNQVVTEIKYKDGKTVTVTKTDTVEVEKIKEIDKLKIIKNKHQIAVLADVNLNGIHTIGAMYYTPLILGFDIGAGVLYKTDNDYNVLVSNNNSNYKTNRVVDRFSFLISFKYNF